MQSFDRSSISPMTGSNLDFSEYQHHGSLEDLSLQGHQDAHLLSHQDHHGLFQEPDFGSSEHAIGHSDHMTGEQDMEKFINAFLQVGAAQTGCPIEIPMCPFCVIP